MPNNDNRRRFGRDRSYINMSGKVGGKNYELIDVENLKEANKQMAEMIRHQQEFIDKQDERIRNQDEISEQEREYYRNNKKNIEDMTKRMEENNKVITGWNRNIRSNIINNPNKDNILDSLINRSASNQQVPRTLTDLLRHQMQKNNRKEVDEIYNKAVKSVVNSYKRKGADFSDPAVMSRVNRDIQDKVLANDEFNKITKKFGTKAELFNVAVGTFKEAVGVWSRIFNDGIQNQSRVFNDTFENISVRNGTTRSQYYNAQIGLQGQLGSAGVFNNIASSEIMTMWNTLATNGVKLDVSNREQTVKAIETVITQHIVPYLDTNSKDFTILNSRIGDRFIKDIRGINEYNMQVAGNSYQTQELMQEIIDQVQPMSDEALENLAQGSAEVTAMINKLTPIMGADAAKSYATQLFKTQRYSDQVMRSGSLTERMSLYGAINNGINVYDPTQWNDYLGLAVDTSQMIRGWTPGYGSTLNGLVTNVVGSASGEDYNRMWGAGNLTAKGLTGSGIAALTDLTPEELQNLANNKTNAFTGDENQTNKKLQDVTVENLANEFAFLDEWLGNWAQVIKKAIEGIGLLISAKIVGGIIGKSLGALSGLGGNTLPGTLGLGKLLGTAGPLLGSLAVIGAGVGIAAAAAKTIASKNVSNAENQAVATGNLYNDYKNGSITNGVKQDDFEATVNSLNEGQQRNKGGFFSNQYSLMTIENKETGEVTAMNTTPGVGSSILDYYNWTDGDLRKELFGNQVAWYKKGSTEARDALNEAYKKADADRYNKIKAYTLSMYLNSQSGAEAYKLAQVMGSLMVAAYYQNQGTNEHLINSLKDSKTFNLPNFYSNKDDIKNYLDKAGITKASELARIFAMLDATDTYFMVNSNDFLGFPKNAEQLQKIREDFNLHRYGLASVPYDEYPALLHQGEAVLTATTAAELRNLLEEYRQTSQQSINFDNIIQRQTSALVNKIDEVIKTIEHNKIGTFSNTDSMHKSRELLADSMRYMKSTKSF